MLFLLTPLRLAKASLVGANSVYFCVVDLFQVMFRNRVKQNVIFKIRRYVNMLFKQLLDISNHLIFND